MLQLALFISIVFCNAQIKTKTFDQKIPDHLKPSKGILIQEYLVPNPKKMDSIVNDPKEIKPEDFINNFAVSAPVIIDVLNNAKIVTNQETIAYHFKIKAGSAKNLSLHFGKFNFRPLLVFFTNKCQRKSAVVGLMTNNNAHEECCR